jgi:Flp pilus assembly protein TadD
MLGWVLFAYEWSGGRAHDYQVGYGTGVTWWTYGLTECRVVVNYLRLAFWPHPQVVDFGLTVLSTSLGEVAPYALLLLVLVALTLVALRHRPALGFLGCWFFIILSPTSSVVPIAGQSAGEHHMYLPLIAVIVIVVGALCSWLGTRSLYVLLALAVPLGWRTVRRNGDYRSATAFYGSIVGQRPDNYFARYNLAKALADEGSIDAAAAQFQEAVRLAPDDAMPHLGFGDVLSGQGRLDDAIAQYEAAARIDPRSSEARCDLGNALFREGRLDEAVEQYREAVRIDPDNGGVCYNLGLAQSQLGRLGDAIASYRQALRVGGDIPGVRANLGAVLARAGRFPEAAAELQAALQLDPSDANARRNYELVLRRLGR